jgi:hypothetical protein
MTTKHDVIANYHVRDVTCDPFVYMPIMPILVYIMLAKYSNFPLKNP